MATTGGVLALPVFGYLYVKMPFGIEPVFGFAQ
jgi:hypothetical protein